MADPFDPDPRASERVVREALRRGQRRRRARRAGASALVAAAIVVVVTLAAVGSFGGGREATHVSTSPTTTTTTTPAKRTTTTTTTTPAKRTTTTTTPAKRPTSTTAPSKPSSPTTRAATSACQAKQLQVTLTLQNGSMGTGLAQVLFRNTSTVTCTLEGYPQVSLANSAGRSSGQSTDTTPGQFANPPLGSAPAPVTVTLAANSQAVVWFTWQDNPVGSQTDANCVSPVREVITPPGNTGSADLSQPLNTLVCSAPLVEPVEAAGFVPNGLQGGA